MVGIEIGQSFPVEDVDRVPGCTSFRLFRVRSRATRGKNIRTLSRELIHDGKADPRGASKDNCPFTCKIHYGDMKASAVRVQPSIKQARPHND